MRLGIVAMVVPLVLFGLLGVARADRTDERGETLRRGEPYKVRLSAALWLSNRPPSDERAVGYLIEGLERDRESTVRRVAALALARLVAPETPTSSRDRALAALAEAARGDRDRKVRANARRALGELRVRLARAAPTVDERPTTGIFLAIDPAHDPSRRLPPAAARALEAAVRGAIGRKAPHIAVGGPAAVRPTVAALRQAGQRGFLLVASVVELTTARRGGEVDVHCKVALRVSPWAGADAAARLAVEQTASATGSGMVTSSGRQPAGAYADCVVAVAEEVTVRQVLPFLRRFEGRAGR